MTSIESGTCWYTRTVPSDPESRELNMACPVHGPKQALTKHERLVLIADATDEAIVALCALAETLDAETSCRIYEITASLERWHR